MTRGQFIKIMLGFAGVASVLAWRAAVSKDRSNASRLNRVYLDPDTAAPYLAQGIIVMTRESGKDAPLVLRNKCTHLGCALDLYPDGRLVCPCHGSEFDRQGHAVHGPARDRLEELQVSWDDGESRYYVDP